MVKIAPPFSVPLQNFQMNLTPHTKPLSPGATLGVLGGGQLGRMFVHCAQTMGYKTAVLDPDPQSPAGLVSHFHLVNDFTDQDALAKLAQLCDAVTTEFENVPAQALDKLSKLIVVNPSGLAVSIAQDRIREKQHFINCNVPVAPHVFINSEEDLRTVGVPHLPGILKTARLGYDGKGQIRVRNLEEVSYAWLKLKGYSGSPMPCVLEKLLPLELECSIILGRKSNGQIVHLPPQRNIHRDGILALTQVHDGCLSSSLSLKIIEYAKSIANELDYVGVLCIEFFVLNNGNDSQDPFSLVVNEIAPRPHNSGHYSVEACDVSQFELQVRCLTDMPLISPRQHSPALMLNLLGDLWAQVDQINDSQDQSLSWREPDWQAILNIKGAHLNLYGKASPRLSRKMGHITFTGDSVTELYHNLAQATRILGIAPFDKP